MSYHYRRASPSRVPASNRLSRGVYTGRGSCRPASLPLAADDSKDVHQTSQTPVPDTLDIRPDKLFQRKDHSSAKILEVDSLILSGTGSIPSSSPLARSSRFRSIHGV